MTRFRKAHRIYGIAAALGLLAVATTGADAAPIQFTISDLGTITGTGLDNDGNVIDKPIRNIVGKLGLADPPVNYGGNSSIIDGTADGRLLVMAFGTGSVSSIPHSFVYDPHYTIPGWEDRPMNLILGMGSPTRWTAGRDMNAQGDVVGSASWGDADESRLFYNEAGTTTLHDLAAMIPPNSGWKLTDVYSINDRGQILGMGVNPQGEASAFLLTPAAVPEPGAWAVFGLTASAFAWRKRRAG
jgi:hypothetical protein